eukprot:CAMPEP_0180159904 /NCGR_PEP_ID=MMETSP0986-20121125/27794_1 /TAXON_ID=697907 /ORGANISM="non described non described, Strain CCMP2293" /LENGTH=103 /DNA_ID=CAMNT_0022110063 /DNA_START=447 /DNA_END=759 /DNA_ORIENTATION=+
MHRRECRGGNALEQLRGISDMVVHLDVRPRGDAGLAFPVAYHKPPGIGRRTDDHERVTRLDGELVNIGSLIVEDAMLVGASPPPIITRAAGGDADAPSGDREA